MVDGHDDAIAGTLADLHRLTFFDGASIPKFEQGLWWLAFYKANAVAFAGIWRRNMSITRDISAACARIAFPADRLGRRGVYHRQPCFRQQFYPCRLSTVPAAMSVGLAKHAVLAQIHQVFRCVFDRCKPINY
jgi:hypothetical protein